MKGLIVRLWPGEAFPGSYFGLVRRLVEACPRLEVIKRSVCIEGARRALSRAKVHWGKLGAEKLVKDGPPPGKEHRTRTTTRMFLQVPALWRMNVLGM